MNCNDLFISNIQEILSIVLDTAILINLYYYIKLKTEL